MCVNCPEKDTCTEICESLHIEVKHAPLKEVLMPDNSRDAHLRADYKATISEIRDRKDRNITYLHELITDMDNIQNKAIASMLLTGMKINQISFILNLSEPQIYYIIRKMSI